MIGVSVTQPSTPVVGQQWFDLTGGQTYVWVDDGNSQQWVIAVNSGSPDLTPYALKTDVPVASALLPIMDSVAAVGVGATWARSDHVHPTDTSRAAASALTGYLPLTGGTLSGLLTANGGVTAAGVTTSGFTNLTGWTVTQATGTDSYFVCADSAGTAKGYLYQSNGGIYISNATSGNYIALPVGGGVSLNAVTTVTSDFFVNGTPVFLNNPQLRAATPNIVFYNAAVSVEWGRTGYQGSNVYGTRNTPVNTWWYHSADGSMQYNGGNGVAYKSTTGQWTGYSDARIKTVHGSYEKGLADIIKLNPIMYTYRGNNGFELNDTKPHAVLAEAKTPLAGLIAQEVELVFPDMVGRVDALIDERKVDDLRTLNLTELTFATINAFKELKAEIDALKAEIVTLKAAR